MVGASGSGKSTFSAKLAEKLGCPIICPDSIREELTGDAGNQDKNGLVFQLAEKRLAEAMVISGFAVYDATNYNAKNRQMVERVAQVTVAKIIWYVFQVEFAELVRRQGLRERKVPVEVIERQFNNMTIPSGEVVFV
jgi:predicted kinase